MNQRSIAKRNISMQKKFKQLAALICLALFFFSMPILINNNEENLSGLNQGEKPGDGKLSNSAADKTLNITVVDRGYLGIPGAFIQIDDHAGTIKYGYSNSAGNVTFTNIDNAVWYILVKYSVGDRNIEYVINTSQYTLNVGAGGFANHTVLCNLTTVQLEVGDAQLSHDIWGLYNANVTIVNATTNQNMTSFYTEYNGFVTIRLPTTDYKVNVQYQGKSRMFHFVPNSEGYIADYVKNLTLIPSTPSYIYEVWVYLQEISTDLSIVDYTFENPSWGPLEDYTKPYSIGLYFEDVVVLKIAWKNTNDNSGITHPPSGTWNSWTIKRGSVTVNSSSSYPNSLIEVGSEDGNYTFVFDTKSYYAGVYRFTLTCSKSGYADAILIVDINIWNFTTSIEINRTVPIHVGYSQSLDLMVKYSTTNPYVKDISDSEADLFYKIEGVPFSGQLTFDDDADNFTMIDVGVNIPVGTYDLIIYGNGTNYDFVYETYIFIVEPIETEVVFLIDDLYRINPTFLKVAHGENVTFLVNYTTIEGEVISGSTLNVYVNENLISSAYRSLITSGIYQGLWNVSFAANLYTPGMYTIKTQLIKQNYEETNATLTASILDFWNTRIDVVEAPSDYIWGENASFRIKYVCDENIVPAIRNNLALVGGTINKLDISIKQGLNYVKQITFDTERGTKWNWTDLSYLGGEYIGVYEIWFSTLYLNLSQTTKFYAIPSIQKTLYRVANSTDIYLDVHTLDTNLVCFNNTNPIAPLTFFKINRGYSESIEVRIQLNVSQPGSIFDGLPINNALVQFYVKNKSDDTISISPTVVSPAGNGKYLYTLSSTNPSLSLGQFRFYVNASLENYTYAETSFDFNVTDIINFNIVIPDEYRASSTVVKAALNENFTFYIDLAEESADAIVVVTVDDDPTPISWLYSLGGSFLYEYNCTKESLSFSTGTYTIHITATKGEYATLEQSIQLQIIEKWATGVEVKLPPAEMQWNHNQSFVVRYYCSESPRVNYNMTSAEIDYLYLNNQTSIVLLDSSTKGILWGWSNLSHILGYEGCYEVWFNTSVFYVENSSIVIAAPLLIGGTLYEDNNYMVPMNILPVSTSLVYNATATPSNSFTPNFALLQLLTGESTTIQVNYSVTDSENIFFGKPLNISDTIISYVVQNRSNNDEICLTGDFEFDNYGSYLWNWTVGESDLSQHDFLVTITARCMNYTIQIREFLLVIGQSETICYHEIYEDLKGNPNNQNSLKVAHGENLTVYIIFPNMDEMGNGWVRIYLDDILLPEENMYWINDTAINYTTPITSYFTPKFYDAKIIAGQRGYIATEILFSVKIMDYWPSDLHVVEPPWMYPWGNIVSMNTSYYCTEYPRENRLLSGATVTNLQVILILEGTTQLKLSLSETDRLAGVWGYSEMLTTKGPGYYNIWFNSSFVDLDVEEIQSYYLVPTIQWGVYNESEAKPRPNYSIYPVGTHAWIEQTTSVPDLDLNNMVVYLNEDLQINFYYFVNDINSFYYNTGIDGALVHFRVINRTDDSLFLSGDLIGINGGIYPWKLPTMTIGNFSINITVVLRNYETREIIFNLLVKKFDASHDFILDSALDYIQTPQNHGFNITFTLTDKKTQLPLTGGTVTLRFNNVDYLCYEIVDTPGMYTCAIPVSELKKLNIGESYPATITFVKTNYTDYSFSIQVRIDLPVDPYFGIPYIYWIIIAVSIGAFISIMVIRHSIIQAKVPIIIKKIDYAAKLIQKKRSVPDKKLALSYNEEVYRQFRQDWSILDLDISNAINLKKEEIEALDEDLRELIDIEQTEALEQKIGEKLDEIHRKTVKDAKVEDAIEGRIESEATELLDSDSEDEKQNEKTKETPKDEPSKTEKSPGKSKAEKKKKALMKETESQTQKEDQESNKNMEIKQEEQKKEQNNEETKSE